MTTLLAVPRFALGTGSPLAQAPLIVHVAAGMVAIVVGYVALFAVKGAGLHRKSGILFVYAMMTMGLVGATLAAFEHKIGSVIGGLTAAYFVVTALTAVRERTVTVHRVELAGLVLALSSGVASVALGLDAALRGVRQRDGVPVGASITVGAIVLLAGIGDVRMMRAGGLQGASRIARHLWRMSYALFVATGSFFLGQAKVIPKPLRVWSVLLTLAFLPLAAMLYWLWRVRVRRSLRRLVLLPQLLRGAQVPNT